ncbi:MAG: hypothetical protein OXN90_08810, partial [Gemmatimonadota bacterium]|nr:hypothetical protein [Gemmatimonadota bacterium]
VHLLLTPVSLGVSDGDVDQSGDAIFPFCYDGSYPGVRLLKLIVGGTMWRDNCQVCGRKDAIDVRSI